MDIQNCICELLQKYKKNMDRQRELDELLLTEQSKEEWIVCLKNRARENQDMFAENGNILEELDGLLQNPLDEDAAEKITSAAEELYMDGYDDCELLLPVFYRLEQYYEEHENLVKLLFLYSAIFYEESEVKSRRQGQMIIDETYNYKILEYKSRYSELPYEGGRMRIWVSYYNLIVVGVVNKGLTADESYQLYQEAMEFWNSPEVQKLDGENPNAQELISRISNEWLAVEENIEQAAPETKELFCKIAGEAYAQQMQEKHSVQEINNEVYAAYLHSKVLSGERDFESIIDEYFAYYIDKIRNRKEGKANTSEDFYFIVNTPLILGRWLGYGKIPEGKVRSIVNALKTATQVTWYKNLDDWSSVFLNEVMAEWCFTLMKYLDSDAEKEEWLIHLLVRRQLPTYLHSTMVMQLAEALCKEVNRSHPELLEDLDEECRKDLIRYVRQCALLHDVGKTRITDVVNTQCRRLADWEFQGIKRHPEYGAQMLDKDPGLAKYRDVALGHHRFYDGTGGYPQEYDNTKSPYRIITDMITICDCIDAATDHLGRNYKHAKDLEMVLKELVAGKGTRYNPDLVEVIEHSSRLQRELQYIVSDGRLDIFYRAYLESVLN